MYQTEIEDSELKEHFSIKKARRYARQQIVKRKLEFVLVHKVKKSNGQWVLDRSQAGEVVRWH